MTESNLRFEGYGREFTGNDLYFNQNNIGDMWRVTSYVTAGLP